MTKMSIGEVAKRAGVETSALRYYESVGLIGAPKRVSGQRRYDASVLDRLEVLRLAKEAGFTLAEVRTLFDGFDSGTPPSDVWQSMARKKLPDVERLIARAEAMKQVLLRGIACECLTLEECSLLAVDGLAAAG